jgi:hypothetical protein
MPRDHDHNPDPNAARIVRESTAGDEPLPADVETAWAAWSAHIQNVDQSSMTLLRAAFEAATHPPRDNSGGQF